MTTCKYHTVGWPTEKERDRHVNDKHSDTPALFKCSFKPCTYASKRESNCKQHMEKAHGWVYVRSKNNARGGSKRGSSHATPATPSVSTPASKPADFPTPVSAPSSSPVESSGFTEDPTFDFNAPLPARNDNFQIFDNNNSPYSISSAGFSQDFQSYPTSVSLDSLQAHFQAGAPNELISSLETHRQSMNSISVPSAESVPELMDANGTWDGSPIDPSLTFDFDLDWEKLAANPTQDTSNATQGNFNGTQDNFNATQGNFNGTQGNFNGTQGNFNGTQGNFNGIQTNFNGMQNTFTGTQNNFNGTQTNYTAMPMQFSTPASSGAQLMPNAPYGASGKMAGLSPRGQGHLTLYSPESGASPSEYLTQCSVGNDFTLYDQSSRMGAANMGAFPRHPSSVNGYTTLF